MPLTPPPAVLLFFFFFCSAGWREITPELHAAAMNASWGSRKEQLAFRGGRTSEERKLLFDYLKIHTEPLFDSVLSAGLLRRLAALNCSFPTPVRGLCMNWDFLVTCPAAVHTS